MQTLAFSNTFISKIQPPQKELEVTDPRTSGLKLRVAPSGTKTFYLYYVFEGKKRKYKIARFGDIGVPAARETVRKLHAKIALGEDIQGERKRARINLTKRNASKLRKFLDDQYYSHIETHQKSSRSTKRIIEHNFEKFMAKGLLDITPSLLDKWRQKKLAAGKKPTTINRAVTTIKAVLSSAEKWGVVGSSPLKGYSQLKIDNRGIVRWLSNDEENLILKTLNNKTIGFKSFIILLLNTGARPSELLSLKWDNISGKQITLQAAFTKSNQTRHIPLNAAALTALNDIRQNKSPWCFPSDENKSGHITRYQKQWMSLMKDTEIQNLRLYDLRHSFASKLVMKGVDLYTVSQLLGHSSLDMTQIYAHLAPEHLQKAVDLL